MVSYEHFLSKNARNMKRSEIRELLKLTHKPEIIFFSLQHRTSNIEPQEKGKG